MAEDNELYARLAALEQAEQNRATQDFMQKYGGEFSNNEALGSAILSTLQSRGAGISDEAVAGILDEMRSDLGTLAGMLNMTVSSMKDKIDDATQAIASDNSGTPIAPDIPEQPTAEMPVDNGPAAEVPPPVIPEQPAADTTTEQPVTPAQDTTPAAEQSVAEVPPAPQPLPQNQIPSDVRMKILNRVRQTISDRRMKQVQTPAPVHEPSAQSEVPSENVGRFAAFLGGK